MSTTTTTTTLVERFYGVPKPGTPSEPSLRFLFTLATERHAASLGESAEARVANLGDKLLTLKPRQRVVSQWIDFLKQQPYAMSITTTAAATAAPAARTAPAVTATAEPVEPVGPGVYELDGVVYIVKLNRAKTHCYAQRITESAPRLNANDERVPFEFAWAPGAMRRLRPEHRMTVERAKFYMLRYGCCLACGRELKAAKSVERGIGPVCIKMFG